MTSPTHTLVFVVPGRLDARSGGSIYNSRLVDALRARGWQVDVAEVPGAFPLPGPGDVDRVDACLAAIGDGRTVLFDGLVYGAVPDVVVRHAARLCLVALVHLPLAEETGLAPELADALDTLERRALALASLVVATGRATCDSMARMGVARHRIRLVEPGTDPAPLSRGSGTDTPVLLAVGAVTPRKGHDVLVRALASLTTFRWRLVIAGSLARHSSAVAALRATIADCGLSDRVEFAGELDDRAMAACYDRADLFVLATHHETYGMAVAEALARGLPVVTTATGAAPQLLGTNDGAGLLVPPGDEAALGSALARVLEDATFRRQLAEGARQARGQLPTWAAAAEAMERVLIDAREIH